jgi:rSAM/selenodomain-associated transferase 1
MPNAPAAVLGVFAKEPRPGQVKTRLAAATSPEWAARVAAAFLEDTLDRLTRIDARRVLAHAPDDAGPFFDRLAAGRFELVPQGAGDLGQRMAAFFQGRFAAGATSVVLVGTDSPTVHLGYVERAFHSLASNDLVLGPATDGGYYLIGCKSRVPPIFDGIRWSSRHVLADTVGRLSDPSWRLALLPPWYDVDTLDDWDMLCGHLLGLERGGVDLTELGMPRTADLVREYRGLR